MRWISNERPNTAEEQTDMNWTLELVAIPVTDVDRAKAFYADQVASTPTTTTR